MNDDFKIYRAIALYRLMDVPIMTAEELAHRSGVIAEACCKDDERRNPLPEPVHVHRFTPTCVSDGKGGTKVVPKCECGSVKV